MRALLLNPLALAVVALAPLAAGCTGTVGGSPGAPGTATVDADSVVTQALVLVERTVDTSEGTRAAASARFARVTAGVTPAETLRALGSGLDLPAPGSCEGIRIPGSFPGLSVAATAPTDQSVAVQAAAGATFVELLDLGRVSVETAGATTSLLPRQLPYVTDVVTGTVYARAVEASALPAATPYVVHVSGVTGAGAGAAGSASSFDVVALAPEDASDITVAQEISPGKITASGPTLDFTWASPRPAATGSASDVLYVEVQPAGARCTLANAATAADRNSASHASITTSLLDDSGSVVIHRVHAQQLDALPQRGVDGGELRFDFARVVAYARQ
jgi:hypothetical protein